MNNRVKMEMNCAYWEEYFSHIISSLKMSHFCESHKMLSESHLSKFQFPLHLEALDV